MAGSSSSPVPVPANRGWIHWLLLAAILVGAGGGWYWLTRSAVSVHGHEGGNDDPENAGPQPTKVEVVTPHRGGIDRLCVQPGSVEPFEAADLYAKVSGFLAEQKVDIGSRVKKGQLLATIAVPEYEKQVERDESKVTHARATIKQVEARITASEADARSALAGVALARTQQNARASYRAYREKRLTRLRELNRERAIEAKVVDEAEDQFQAAVEAEAASKEAVTAAEEKSNAANARVLQAQADLDEAKAEEKVAEAELGRSRVLVAYSRITSPYDGVITKRSFNPGDFIRSADIGGDRLPVLAVERTDRVRVVVQVPDRDVPFVDVGDPATIDIDALPGPPLKGAVSRSSESEDAATRTMRTEIDLTNTDGKLRRGMYGRVTLNLQAGSPSAVTIPSAALAGTRDGARASVWIVRDGKSHKVEIKTGADNGIDIEVLAGLTPQDLVVLRANGPLEEGATVLTGPLVHLAGGH
jgi:RND family efflux transporter MFP subunit